MKSRIDDAVNMFESGYACAQSVFTTYADLFGIDRETALKLSGPLSAGVGRMREVCGTVSAMAMLSGLKKGFTDPEDLAGKEESYALVRRMSDAFREQHGTILCRELIGRSGPEDPRPEPRTQAYYDHRACAKYVATAARLLEEYMAEHPPKAR